MIGTQFLSLSQEFWLNEGPDLFVYTFFVISKDLLNSVNEALGAIRLMLKQTFIYTCSDELHPVFH